MHSHRLALPIVVLTLVLSAVGQGVRGEETFGAGQQARFFEREIRPILAENCFKCHGEAKKKGGLRLDSRAAILKGGDSGPAVVPGKPAESLLIEAVHYGSIEMPPSGQLGRREVAALEAWVKLGAPWPSATPDAAAATGSDNRREPGSRFTKADRAWWAFQPVREPSVVVSKDDDWSRNPIDRFIWRELKNQKLAPAPEADKNTLIRRLSFDMLGLPPDPEEIDAFLSDESPDAYESLVDRLLASRHYGEHWARHWLDLVRYADSDGYRVDHFRPNAWLYRDYVIQSLNADKPYDRFVREQIAGDELYPGDKAALIATGYMRHGIYEYNGLDVPGQWAVILNDITDTTGDVFLGLGLQCARCHDHKFDPILQKDYYRLQAFFAPIMFRDDIPIATREEERQYRARMAHWEKLTVTLRDEIEKIQSKYREQARIETIAKFPEDTQALIAKPVEQRTTFEHQIAELAYRQVDFQLRFVHNWATGDDKVKVYALREKLKTFDHEKPKPPPIPLAVADVGPKAPPVTIPRKGSEDVAPGFLSILDDTPARISPIPGVPNTTGRRAALARWLTQPDNPLSTRVIVNRVWQYHFGRGLAASPSDFGRLGERPTHPELLDWLTTRFVREGWSLKRLHRMILTSATYRQASSHPLAEAYRLKDPENRFYWRGNVRRLDAEQIRDAALAVTGELDLQLGGPGVDGFETRRSVYTKVLRNERDPMLDVFDLPLFFSSTSTRDTTTTPLQALFLLNSQTMLFRARSFASRLEWETTAGESGLVDQAFQLAFSRNPTRPERAAALRFLREQALRIDPKIAGSVDPSFLKGSIPECDGQAALLTPDGPQRRLDVPHREPLNTGDFTLEASFLIRSVFENDDARTIVAKWDGDEKKPGWSFGITGRGARLAPQSPMLRLIGRNARGDFVEEEVFANQRIQLDRPYYAAVIVRLAGKGPGEVTFCLKDLSNDDLPLLVSKKPHSIAGGFGNTAPLTIGGQAGSDEGGFDGLIDDVRLSNDPLKLEELLLSNESPSPRTLGFWQFEATPGEFRDSTGHGLDLRFPSHPLNRMNLSRPSLADFCHALLNSSEFLYVD